MKDLEKLIKQGQAKIAKFEARQALEEEKRQRANVAAWKKLENEIRALLPEALRGFLTVQTEKSYEPGPRISATITAWRCDSICILYQAGSFVDWATTGEALNGFFLLQYPSECYYDLAIALAQARARYMEDMEAEDY